jgi:hypothetical protein
MAVENKDVLRVMNPKSWFALENFKRRMLGATTDTDELVWRKPDGSYKFLGAYDDQGLRDLISGKASAQDLAAHVSDAVAHVTQDDRDFWDAKQPVLDFIEGDNITIGRGANAVTISAADMRYDDAAIRAMITGETSARESAVQSLSDALDLKEDRANRGAYNGYAPLQNGKVPMSYLPDTLGGQLIYGGDLDAATGVATLSANGKAKLGTSLNQVTLVNAATGNGSATFGWQDNEGVYYLTHDAGAFASLGLTVGDWLLATNSSWERIANTDAVTSVNGRTGAVTGLLETLAQGTGITITGSGTSRTITLAAHIHDPASATNGLSVPAGTTNVMLGKQTGTAVVPSWLTAAQVRAILDIPAVGNGALTLRRTTRAGYATATNNYDTSTFNANSSQDQRYDVDLSPYVRYTGDNMTGYLGIATNQTGPALSQSELSVRYAHINHIQSSGSGGNGVLHNMDLTHAAAGTNATGVIIGTDANTSWSNGTYTRPAYGIDLNGMYMSAQNSNYLAKYGHIRFLNPGATGPKFISSQGNGIYFDGQGTAERNKTYPHVAIDTATGEIKATGGVSANSLTNNDASASIGLSNGRVTAVSDGRRGLDLQMAGQGQIYATLARGISGVDNLAQTGNFRLALVPNSGRRAGAELHVQVYVNGGWEDANYTNGIFY